MLLHPLRARVAQVVARACAHRTGGSAAAATSAAGRRWYSGEGANGHGAGASAEQDKASFGFTEVPRAEKERLVGDVFRRVASNYDVMNDFMSVGVHRLWKDHFVTRLSPGPATRHLDVAGGTGDIAFRILEKAQKRGRTGSSEAGATPHVTVLDINGAMLEEGRIRAKEQGIDQHLCTWVEASAEDLPLQDNSMDSYTISFGIRNVTNIDVALKEAHRVLRPGGRFMCLEFSHLPNPLAQRLYDSYSFEVIPVLGEVVAGDMASYQYLVESIRKFPTQERFCDMIQEAGFGLVTHENLSMGIAAIHSGFKMPE